MMKNVDVVDSPTDLKLVAAVIDALRKESNPMLDAETRDLFARLSTGLRRCASNQASG